MHHVSGHSGTSEKRWSGRRRSSGKLGKILPSSLIPRNRPHDSGRDLAEEGIDIGDLMQTSSRLSSLVLGLQLWSIWSREFFFSARLMQGNHTEAREHRHAQFDLEYGCHSPAPVLCLHVLRAVLFSQLDTPCLCEPHDLFRVDSPLGLQKATFSVWSHDLCGSRERQQALLKGTNPIMRAPPPWLHPTLIISQSPHCQIPSHWELGVWPVNLEGSCKHSVYNVLQDEWKHYAKWKSKS